MHFKDPMQALRETGGSTASRLKNVAEATCSTSASTSHQDTKREHSADDRSSVNPAEEARNL